jgi:two-component system, chemotaxis family, protein-glutamate methylesterase/glutaminase
MANVRVAIATPSMIDHARLAKIIEQSVGFDLVVQTSDLSATYSKVEELMPDVVLIAAGFARTQEYACMQSLFDAVEAVPIAITSGLPSQEDAPPAQSGTTTLHTRLSADEIIKSIKSALMHKLAPKRISAVPLSPLPTLAYAPDKIVLIGASTGGIDALTTLLAHFPKNCPPTAIVQHTGQNFRETLARLLARRCAAQVVMAEQGLDMAVGRICLAGGIDGHLRLTASGRLSCNIARGAATSGHMPSIDELFLSAVPHGPRVMAVLLTGMGRDGATGLLSLRRAGAATIGQDQGSSVVYGMPRVAYEMGAVQRQMALHQIGPAIMEWAAAPSQSSLRRAAE